MTRDWKNVDTSRSRPRAPRDRRAIFVMAVRGIVAAALVIGAIVLRLATDEAEVLRNDAARSCAAKPDSAVIGWIDPATGKAHCDYRFKRSPVVFS